MRKYIFVTADKREPDIEFAAEKATCGSAHASRDFDCDVSGDLTVRGIPRPLTIKLHIKEQGGAAEYHAAGSGVVHLSDYGIQQPSQFGVKTSNEVSLHLEFTGKTRSLLASNAGEGR